MSNCFVCLDVETVAHVVVENVEKSAGNIQKQAANWAFCLQFARFSLALAVPVDLPAPLQTSRRIQKSALRAGHYMQISSSPGNQAAGIAAEETAHFAEKKPP